MLEILQNWFRRYFTHPEAVSLFFILLFAIIAIALLGNILVPIIVSLIIAYLLNGFVKRLEKWKIPHYVAFIFMYLLFIGIFVVLFVWLLPLFFQQLGSFISEVPRMLNKGLHFLTNLQVSHPDIFSTAQLQRIVTEFEHYLTNVGRYIVSVSLTSIDNIITIVVYVILVPLLVFFFLRDRSLLGKWSTRFLPQKHPVLTTIWQAVDKKIDDYIRGKILELIIVAIASIIAFTMLGLNYAILLGVCVGIAVIIPYVGAVIVTIPVVALGLLQWGLSAHFAYLIIIYAIITTLDANVLVPILFSEKMNLHPVVIMLAILIFGSIWGFWGVFFAIPLATLIQTLLKLWPRVE